MIEYINYILRYLFTCVEKQYYENNESDHMGSNIYKIDADIIFNYDGY